MGIELSCLHLIFYLRGSRKNLIEQNIVIFKDNKNANVLKTSCTKVSTNYNHFFGSFKYSQEYEDYFEEEKNTKKSV